MSNDHSEDPQVSAAQSYTRRRVIAGTGAAAVVAGLAMKGISLAQDATPEAPAESPASPVAGDYTTLPAIPPEITQFADDWPAPQANLANHRTAQNAAINSSNVAGLEVAWAFSIAAVSAYGGSTATPIIAGDVIYLQDQSSNVFAIDRNSGEQIWSKSYDSPTIGPNGVALGYGKIFGSTGDGRSVFALDAESGEEVWNVLLSGNAREGIDMAPQVHGGLVYISTVPGNSETFYEGGARGVLYALDATSGQVIWQFYTVDDDLWGQPTVNSGGGSWYPPAVDEAGNTYWDIANPAPFQVKEIDGTPITLGSTFDDGLYSNTLVKLSPDGVLEWHFAANRHDIFDHDLQQSPVLATIDNDGQPYTVALASGKLGRVFAVEVETGLMVWDAEVGDHTNWDNSQWVPPGQTVTVLPGVSGGVESPIAYADGTVYVPILNMPSGFSDQGLDASTISFNDATGQLIALDVFDGTQKWSVDLPAGNVSSATVANDVVFAGALDGIVRAYNTADGSLLWSYDTGVGLNAPFAVAGDLLVVPAAGLRLVADSYQPEATPVATGDTGPALIAFKLPS